MDKRRLRGFLKEHIFKSSFTMSEVSTDGDLQIFKIGSVIAACSKDTEKSRKAVLDYVMSIKGTMYASFLFRDLSDEEAAKVIQKRIFTIRGGGAYYL